MSGSRKRWRPKRLDIAPDASREWLIWSMYHKRWHCRSSTGGAAGYTSDILEAGIFETRKAREYHDGVRDRAIHASKAFHKAIAARSQIQQKIESADQAINLFKSAIAAAGGGA